MIFGGIQKSSTIDFPGVLCCVLFTRGCDLNCFYCHNRELIPRAGSALPEEEVWAFLEKRRQEEEPEKGVKPVPKQNDYKLRKQKESELRKLKTRVRRAEEEIDGLDRETAELAGRLSDPETASDYEKALELTQRMEELRARQEKLMESWEALCQELEEKEAR